MTDIEQIASKVLASVPFAPGTTIALAKEVLRLRAWMAAGARGELLDCARCELALRGEPAPEVKS